MADAVFIKVDSTFRTAIGMTLKNKCNFTTQYHDDKLLVYQSLHLLFRHTLA